MRISSHGRPSCNANGAGHTPYSQLDEIKKARETLLAKSFDQIPAECVQLIKDVTFTSLNHGLPDFPCPFKESEAIAALKAAEAGMAAAIANLALGESEREAVVNVQRGSCFLFSTYLATIGGHTKADPKSKALLKSNSSYFN
jgi:hypothetical protein